MTGYGLDGAIRLDTDQLVAILEVLEHVTDEIPGRAVLQAELERRRRLGMGMVDQDHQLGVCPHCGLTETVTPSLAHPDQLTCWPPSGGCGAMWRGARTGTPR